MSNEANGWKKFTKSEHGSYLGKYDNRIVVIVSGTKPSTMGLYLTTAVQNALGDPEFIEIFTRGNNAALVPCNDSSGFKVSHRHENSFARISVQKFSKTYRIKAGIYDAHIEGKMIVFDMYQTPATP